MLQITPITFTDGKLIADRSTWIGNDNTPVTENRRTQVDILMPDIPTNFKGHSKIDTRDNQYIQFDATSAHKDVMQTTIPYIDAQPVTTSTGSWLAGVGLYHKASPGYGGFVGIQIQTFDFSRHLLPEKTTTAEEMKQELKYDFDKLNEENKVKKGIIR